MKNIIKALSKSTPDDLARRQLEDLRRELLNVQRAKEHYAGLESGLKASIARLENAIIITRETC